MATANKSQTHSNLPSSYHGDRDPKATAPLGSHNTIRSQRIPQRPTVLKKRNVKHLRIAGPHRRKPQNAYLGSYAHTSPGASVDPGGQRMIGVSSPRTSMSHLQLEHLVQTVDADLDTYGIDELRDGFFDASFYRPLQRHHDESMQKAALTLPDSFKSRNHPLSFRLYFLEQLRETKAFFLRISTSRAGIRLLKSFLGFLITYIICLIPASRDWLGRYNGITVISAIVNHPGRAIGSQIDGAILTITGTIAGLGWGSLALYISTSTFTARSGYGGVLATFLVIFAAVIGWLRCLCIRFYQAVLSAGFAIAYICLADTSQDVSWVKVFDYGIPWVLGQAVCLIVSFAIFPDAGTRSLALALHDSLQTIRDGLDLPREDSSSLRQKLAFQFVRISQRVRDFVIEFTFSRFSPDDARSLRNLIQAVDRSILAIRPDTSLFNITDSSDISISSTKSNMQRSGQHDGKNGALLVCSSLREPTGHIVNAMIEGIRCADEVVLDIGGREALQDAKALYKSLEHLRTAKIIFDSKDALLAADPDLPSLYHKSPDVAELFLFIHPVRQTADKVENLMTKVLEMQSNNGRRRVRPPSYPLRKAILRTNAQVRHDRGGLTAGFYFRSKQQLERTMADLASTAYIPAVRQQDTQEDKNQDSVMGEYQLEQELASGKLSDVPRMMKFRYRLWEALHRLQGFESRFAFKVTLVTTLLSIPAWLPQSRDWWNEYESWWAVVTVWIMMHPRVGGTIQDLAVRVFCAALGAVWGGLAYAADGGNPYVMAVFAALYMLPMLYRFTQSPHPRSGIIGCLSFTVVSLSAYTEGGKPSTVTLAWTRGLAFVIGVVAALTVNWILWPFVARHELRKSLSAMMLHSAILYRGVVAKYVYHSPGEGPGPEDIARSEMLEGRLREGFVRMRQLMELTRHEMRLRAPFDPLPYSALIAACESFFEHLVQVRQSSLYFQLSMLASDPKTVSSLTAPRRDAVAVILLNLYILASALRADQPVPRYLPDAAGARQKLLDHMDVVEGEQAKRLGEEEQEGVGKGRRWADVYQYAFSGALTDIVGELQELQRFTKEICGEVKWGDEEVVVE